MNTDVIRPTWHNTAANAAKHDNQENESHIFFFSSSSLLLKILANIMY